ncbi:FBD-associated F-box protein At5g56370-like isoform X4 [Panicum virgatum]|uniref:FBD-associated F-box protein At5g56370-like isoform X4 n=1 Tax=Panicum virgatum TaxID=38727 RepID=UPI0019D566E3|nr:FBD-associated F-box protein At5g56370-like isoform X4 [Panicum virgatum]
MRKRSRENCEEPAATASNDDRLGSLPDDALLHVLSLLPSEDAVRTCVLARRWRHLWRFTAALRIARDDGKRWSVRWLHSSISAPSLVSLQLSDNWGFTPVLESMPSLAKAIVRFDDECCEKCPRNYYGDCGLGDCDGCYGNLCLEDDEDNQCVLLKGLSGTTNLELIGLPEVFVCRKDFKWRPTFRKLKTLLLNEWCVADDFSLLIYFLQHSPILEKLTLQLSKVPEPVVKANGCHSPREGSMVSKCLKAIEVKYQEDGVLDKLLTILNTYGVSSDVVTIQKKDSLSSEKFSFEQRIKTDATDISTVS